MNKVLFISLDSVRSDYLCVEGDAELCRKFSTPNLYNLSKNGLLFKNTFVQVPFTVPSHTCMFTGMYPFNHGVRDQRDRLNHNVSTIFDILQSHGFEIASFSDVAILKDRGFNWNYCGECTLRNLENKLEELKNQKFFIFVHYWDVHTPYKVKIPNKNIKDIIANSLPKFNSLKKYFGFRSIYNYFWLYKIKRIRKIVLSGDKEIISKIKKGYIQSIQEADGFIGDLVQIIKKIGILDDTLIVITADHGDSFNEHNEIDSTVDDRYEHGQFLFDNVLRVPLIFYLPSRLPSARIESQVREIDILPTILEILKIDNEELKASLNFDGWSLLPYIYQNDNPNQIEYIYSEVVRKDLNKKIEKRSLRTKDYKIIVDFVKGERKLFDLNSDPEELCNIYDIQKEGVSELENILNGYLTKDESKGGKENVTERIKELKSLGRI